LLPVVRAACRGLDNFFILGWSFSGPLALMAAAESPPGLRGVVLCATFVSPPWPLVRHLRFASVPGVARLFPLFSKLLAIGGGYETPDLRQDKRELFRQVPAAAYAARTRAVLDADVGAYLRHCPVPVMYLAGSNDIVVPRWNARAAQHLRPSMDLVTIDGPHLALRTSPVSAARAVANFMAVDGSGRITSSACGVPSRQ
jgi:pimeloyl-ACP methyl ester carboxylesterase